MIEGQRKLFESGAGTVIFSPLLLLFVVVGLGGFVGISLVAVTAAAFLGGAFLRSRALTVSKSSRWMLFSAVMCQFAFVLLAIKRKAPFLLDRPRLHPNAYLVAFIEYL